MIHRKATTLGLDERTERVLAYLFIWISGIFFLLFEKNRNVRWHALQSTLVFGALSLGMFAVMILKAVLGFRLSLNPLLTVVLGSLTAFGLNVLVTILVWVSVILWLWLMWMAFFKPHYRLPFFNINPLTFLRK